MRPPAPSPRPARRPPARTLTLALSALLAGLPASCAPHAAPASTGSVRASLPEGISVQWWVVDDAAPPVLGKQKLPDVLEPYHAATLAPATLALWRANGLEVRDVPAKDLELWALKLSTIGPVQEQRLGYQPRWGPILQGPSWIGPRTLLLDSGPVELDPGCLRLLARCWAEPTPAGTRLRLEIVPEHATPRSATPDFDAALAASESPASHRGLVLERLSLAADIDARAREGRVWIITPAREQPAPTGVTLGAPFARSFTLGEALLTDLPSEGPGRTIVLAVFVRAPERLNLLP